jgi:hypothetical protein
MANLAALLADMREFGLKWTSRPLRIWLLAYLRRNRRVPSPDFRELENKRLERIEGEENLNAYLVIHDEGVLKEADARIPCPDSQRLKSLLDQKIVQSLLPPNLVRLDHAFPDKSNDSFSGTLFFVGALLVGASSGIFCYLLFRQCEKRL